MKRAIFLEVKRKISSSSKKRAVFLDVDGKVSQLENQRDVLTVMRSEGM